MTEFQNKSFSVYSPGGGSKQYRDNWESVFGKRDSCGELSAQAVVAPPAPELMPVLGSEKLVLTGAYAVLSRPRTVGGMAIGDHKEEKPEPTPGPRLCECCELNKAALYVCETCLYNGGV